MERSYYSDTIKNFLQEAESSILGKLTANHSNSSLSELQINAWKKQIQVLKNQLQNFDGKIYFEFTIPRMGKRVDNIIIIHDTAFILEFKIGYSNYDKNAIEQVIDYTIDLKNFHEGSHNIKLIPILLATNANEIIEISDNVIKHKTAAKANQNNLKDIFNQYVDFSKPAIDTKNWENSIYKPTPTIVEAAQALYKGHNVKEITRSDAGAINLSKTSNRINAIIENSKSKKVKSICFVTGVPGAGKTLAGLNIAVERMKTDVDEHAVFLSGNGPLVEVLREALTRDEVETAKENGYKLTKKDAAIKANTFIQNIHHFRDDNIVSKQAPVEKVIVFDEAQRAWTKHQLASFMKRKKGIENFDMSEPEFLINIMDRHRDWSTIVCLIGGGQEINTGEAGIEEWIRALKFRFQDWHIHYSNSILESDNYLKSEETKNWLIKYGTSEPDLHLAVSVRSFRSERVSEFVHALLNLDKEKTKNLYSSIRNQFPIVLTRDLSKAKEWLKNKAKGSERIGIISSSGARRLRPFGIDVKNEIYAPYWFLNDKTDIRSSYFLEDVATEFDIQGLEIDWACVAWGANFYIDNGEWNYQSFKGTKWQHINKEIEKEYLKNTYRVLLTRSRQGMVIFLPSGSKADHTRPNKFYDQTYKYLKGIGIDEI